MFVLLKNLGKNNGCNYGYLSQLWKNCLSKMYYKANFFNIWHTYTVNENSYFFVQNLHLNQIRPLWPDFLWTCLMVLKNLFLFYFSFNYISLFVSLSLSLTHTLSISFSLSQILSLFPSYLQIDSYKREYLYGHRLCK